MGFGLLFIGYFITFVMTLNNFKFIIAPVGYVVILLALLRLRRYERRFHYALICSMLLILFGSYNFLHGGAEKLGIALPAWDTVIKPAADWVLFIAEAALSIALLLAIAALAGGLELTGQRRAAWRNTILVGVYFITDTTRMTLFPGSAAANQYLLPPVLLLRLCYTALNLILIYSCYMRICPEGDEDMPEREPRFKFIRELFDRTGRARKETQEYRDNQSTHDGSTGTKPNAKGGTKNEK
jgi:hypothetical protein